MEQQLVKQKQAALMLGIGVATLRRYKNAPRVYLDSPTGGKPLLRYDPVALRLWWSLQQPDGALPDLRTA